MLNDIIVGLGSAAGGIARHTASASPAKPEDGIPPKPLLNVLTRRITISASSATVTTRNDGVACSANRVTASATRALQR